MDKSFNIDGANTKQYTNDKFHNPDNIEIANDCNFESRCFHVCNIQLPNPRYPETPTKFEFASNYINTTKFEDKYNVSNEINRTKLIPARQLRWWIKVPIQLADETKLWIRMLADSAANKPCANLYWINKHFKDSICVDKYPTQLSTAGGNITPNTVFSFHFQQRMVVHLNRSLYCYPIYQLQF